MATSLKRVHQITGKPEAVTFCDVDLRDAPALARVFAATSFETVIHFAAFKVRRRAARADAPSVAEPLLPSFLRRRRWASRAPSR